MEITKLMTLYSLNNFEEINKIEPEKKDKLLLELLKEMSNDKNSSLFRESVSLGIIGVIRSDKKLGYDSESGNVEVKPKNIISDSIKKFDGSGNFSDFTWARHKKYQNDNVKMVVSGFLDGKIMFVCEFDYNSKSFIDEIDRQLTKHLPNGDELNRYVRSVKFSYLHFKDSDTFQFKFISPIISEYESKFTKPFYKIIKQYGIKE